MEDYQIVDLYWKRDETAIYETDVKYGKYCFSISYNILHDSQKAEECVNDTYWGAWNAMPPHRPAFLSTFLGKITRRLSLKRWRDQSARKRGRGMQVFSLEELEECIPSGKSIDEKMETQMLTGILDDFLEGLPVDERRVFLRRYWYCDAIQDIAARFHFSESKVKMMLKRTRDKLRVCLEKEEIWV